MVALRAVVVAVLSMAVALAGCSDGQEAADGADDGQPRLSAGKGAIAGLLVDDRYRPLHLTDTPQAEFDATGFILLVETGLRIVTDGNGEFTVTDLEPGVFTLKPAVDGHEGAPLKVEVVAGQYAEVDLIVRRLVVPALDAVAVHDDSLLVTCSMQVLDGHLAFGRICHGDLDEPSETNYVDYNWSSFGEVKALVVEVQLSRDTPFEIWLSQQLDVVQLPGDLYTKQYSFDDGYLRYAVVNGTEQEDTGYPVNAKNLRVWVHINGAGSEETYGAFGFAVGADFTFAVRARLVVSAFLEVPADLDTYSVLR